MDSHRVSCFWDVSPISHVPSAVVHVVCCGLFQEYITICAESECRESNIGANRPQREIEIDKDGEEDTETERPSAFPRPPRKLTFARRAHYPRNHFFSTATYDKSKNLYKFSVDDRRVLGCFLGLGDATYHRGLNKNRTSCC